MSTSTHANDASTLALDAQLRAVADDPDHPLASLSVLALRDGRVVYQRAMGRRWIATDPSQTSVAADEDTLYRVASLSKTVTTLGVMRLVEQGRLDLDADVGRYLGFALRNPHFPDTPVTLRMLLSHTSSLRDDAGSYWDAASRTEMREVFTPGHARHGEGRMWSPQARPGQYFAYANLPWGVVATAMEAVTGERFDRLMRRLVLDPLGLAGGFEPAEFSAVDLARVATLYRKRVEVNGGEIWNERGPWVAQTDDHRRAAPVPRARPDYTPGSNGSLFGPQGNCRLSARGVGTLLQVVMDEGRHEGQAWLSPASVQQMMAVQWAHNGAADGHSNGDTYHGRFQAWGLGLQLFRDRSEGATGDRLVEGGGLSGVGHFGDAWGLTALMVVDPQRRLGLVYLSGGPGFDPASTPGRYSSMVRYEERILTALYRHLVPTPPA